MYAVPFRTKNSAKQKTATFIRQRSSLGRGVLFDGISLPPHIGQRPLVSDQGTLRSPQVARPFQVIPDASAKLSRTLSVINTICVIKHGNGNVVNIHDHLKIVRR